MAKFAINASGAMLLPSLVQASESISGSVVPLAMFEKYPPFNCILDKYQMQLGEVVSVQAVSLVAQN